MSHWHYQLMYHKYEEPDEIDGEGYYAIHEYHHMFDNDGWTVNPVTVSGESIEEVKEILTLMLNDIDRHGVKNYE